MADEFVKNASNYVYNGRVIDVRVDEVQYRDKTFNWEIVEMGNAVVIVPVISPGKFVLLYQYRYTVGKYIWEFPAGRAEEGEDYVVAAKRELAEECGYDSDNLQKVLTYYPSPGVITEKMHLYFAFDLYENRSLVGDYDEIIKTEIVDEERMQSMIDSGEIEDAKTILAFYHYQLRIKNQ